jgi:hypothetical protein
MVKVVEHLLVKHNVLSSNTSMAQMAKGAVSFLPENFSHKLLCKLLSQTPGSLHPFNSPKELF